MTWLTRELPDNEPLRRFGGARLPATLGESVSAAFDDPTLSPSTLIARQMALAAAAGAPPPDDLGFFTVGAPAAPEPSPLVAAEDLNREFGALGLSFDRPTRRAVAELLAEGKRSERLRADIVARGPQGFFPGAARLGASFLAAALDPLNVASAFVPVVSQARFAGFVARHGVTGARLARGAIEGTAGNLMVEPFVFGLTSAQRLDYTMADALVNVAFGGLLGAGLHAGLGRIGDWLDRRPPETREAALRSAVAQAASGRAVDVDPILRAEEADLARAYDDVRDRPMGFADDPLVHITPAAIESTIIARGGWKSLGDAEVDGAGWGMVKFIWRHGEKSSKAPNKRVTRDDVIAFPAIIREYEPTRVLDQREWVVARPDGERVLYVDSPVAGREGRRVVTIYVLDDPGARQLSPKRKAGAAGSPERDFAVPSGDTARAPYDRRPGGQQQPAENIVGRPKGIFNAPAAAPAELPPAGRVLENYTLREGDKPHVQAVADDVLMSDSGHRLAVDDPYGPGSTVIAVPATSPAWFRDANKRLKAAGDPPMTRALVETAARKLLAGEPLHAAEARAAAELLAAARDRRLAEARDMAQFRADREARAARAESESLAAVARREAEFDALADRDAAQAARAEADPPKTGDESAAVELDHIAARIEGYRAEGALDARAERELAGLAALDGEAGALGRAAAAAADCLTRI
jgi:hypothetical protein